MIFQKDLLQELVYDSVEIEQIDVDGGTDYGFGRPAKLKLIEKTLEDTTRWSLIYSAVVVVEDINGTRFYQTGWSKGATENQDESPYEYENDEIELVEVWPVEVKTIVYTSVKPEV